MKLAPSPVEYGRTTPLCNPLREPTARTALTCVPAAPRKLIWVDGDASGVPGCGEIATTPLAADLTDALSVTDAAGAAPPHALRPTALSRAASAPPVVVSLRFIRPAIVPVAKAARAGC
jgi:hypothetical protein